MVVTEDMRKRSKSVTRSKAMCALVGAASAVMVLSMSTVTAKASTLPQDVVTVANDLYGDVLTIATPIAVVSFVVALLISFFSHNQRAVDTSRGVAKRCLRPRAKNAMRTISRSSAPKEGIIT